MSKLEKNRVCACDLPMLTGSEECCKACPNAMYLNASSNLDYESDPLSFGIDLSNDEKHLKDMQDEEIGRPSWEDIYIGIARLVSTRSKDPHTKVGAVLVKDGRVIGIGYNGEPRNFDYDFDWHTDEKYTYVVHAEMNAIANACSIGVSCQGAVIYVTLSPCSTCMKLLIQHGIKTVFYIDEYKDFEITKNISEHSNIKLIKLNVKE